VTSQPDKPTRSIPWLIIIVLTIAVSGAVLFIMRSGHQAADSNGNAGSAASSTIVSSAVTPLPNFDTFLQSLPQTATAHPGPAVPARIQIEAINLDILVLIVAMTPQGIIPTPDRYAGYWGASSPLDKNGNAVIVGHNKLTPRPVFNTLSQVKVGDEITVTDQFGDKHLYKITDTLIIKVKGAPAADANRTRDYVQPTTTARLTLITCSPDDTCPDRLVVLAEPVKP
jgi:LPXTG-site transpeptidase (sortase) family protein